MIDADGLMRELAEFVRPSNNSDFEGVPTWNDAVSLVLNAPTIEAEPVKQTIEKLRDYQIEWLTAHNDIEFCEEDENLIIGFLKDTAECAIKFGMDEVEE